MITPRRTDPSQQPLRVAIVEDDRATREALATLIDGTPGFRCVGRYGSVDEALKTAHDRPADVLLSWRPSPLKSSMATEKGREPATRLRSA